MLRILLDTHIILFQEKSTTTISGGRDDPIFPTRELVWINNTHDSVEPSIPKEILVFEKFIRVMGE